MLVRDILSISENYVEQMQIKVLWCNLFILIIYSRHNLHQISFCLTAVLSLELTGVAIIVMTINKEKQTIKTTGCMIQCCDSCIRAYIMMISHHHSPSWRTHQGVYIGGRHTFSIVSNGKVHFLKHCPR